MLRFLAMALALTLPLAACDGTQGLPLPDLGLPAPDLGVAPDGALVPPDLPGADLGAPDVIGAPDVVGTPDVAEDQAQPDVPAPPPDQLTGSDGPTPDGPGCSVNGVEGVCIDISGCTGDQHATPGFCPGPSNIQCCTPGASSDPRDPSNWCPANGMPTPNAGLVEEAGAGGCPDGMVAVSTFCMDRFEAALVEVDDDGSTSSWSPFYNPGTRRMRAVSLRGAVPQGYITGVQARDACEEAGKRLCSDTEWLRACQGPSGFTYPYGNTRMAGVCNDARSPHPAAQCFSSTESWIYSEIDWPGINQQEDSLDRTGSNPGCVTAEGVFDLMGNLHEWTADPAGTFRGGYYVDTVINGNGCLYRTTAHDTSHWDYSTGFRCCAD